MANVNIADLAPATLPLVPALTIIETEVTEAGEQVSRRVTLSDVIAVITDLDSLSDVTITAPATGSVLFKSAGDWIDTDAISIDPAAAVALDFAGVQKFNTTNVGIDIRGSLDNSPSAGGTQDTQLNFENLSGVECGDIFFSGTTMFIRNQVHGGLLTLQAQQGGGSTSTLLSGDPDGAVSLFFDAILELATKAGGIRIDDELEIDGDLNHDGTNVGLYGTAPAPQSAAYTRNAAIVEDRTLLASASATTLNNNNVIAALIADLQQRGFIG